MINPAYDGVDHINIYSKSTNPLGKMLSNFTRYPIETPDGLFQSVEGYWFYLDLEDCPEKENLRNLYGYTAKKTGTELKKRLKTRFDPDFEAKIKAAIWYKFKRSGALITSGNAYLPFEHYYVFGDTGIIKDVKQKYRWMIDAITEMRTCILENQEYILRN